MSARLLAGALLAGGAALALPARSAGRGAGRPAQEPVVTLLAAPPAGHVLDGDAREWGAVAPTFRPAQVRRAGAAVAGDPTLDVTAWVALGPGGLWVAGQVRDPAVRLAERADVVLARDHPEVWVGFAPAEPPPLGYANQFGFNQPGEEGFCGEAPKSECAPWVEAQRRRRGLLRRLFTRQYVPLPDGSVRELFASVAEGDRRIELPAGVAGCCRASRSAVRQTADGYAFELFVAAGDLPMLAAARLDSLWLAVDVVDDARGTRRQGALWSTSPAKRFGEAASFDVARPAAPIAFETNPPLLAEAFRIADSARAARRADPETHADLSGGYSLLYRPGVPVTTLLAFTNEAVGYQYRPDEPSPAVVALGRLRPAPIATCGAATAWLAALDVDGLGRPAPVVVGMRDGRIAGRLGATGDSLAWSVARPPCRHLLLRGAHSLSALGTGAGGGTPVYEVQVVTLDSVGRVAAPVQESAESITLQLMQGRDTVHVWLTPVPVHAGPTGAFGFAWVEDEEKPAPAKQRLLFRWDAARGRYATSDSAGRFR